MASSVAPRFALRHRGKRMDALRSSGRLLAIAVALLAVTVTPMWLLWWETAVPAAIAAAIATLVVVTVLTMVPLETVAYVTIRFDGGLDAGALGLRAGRRLYRASGRLDSLAREAGLAELSRFESPDVLDTGEPPAWYEPRAALPTVDHLLARLDAADPVRRDVAALQRALQAAAARGARFYLLVLTIAGMTNAHIEARRRGEPV
jgi:hypothetical protein